MSKLVFSKEILYKINDHVTFNWLGDTRDGIVERIIINDKGYPIYYIRSFITQRLYNTGTEAGVTATGFIVGKYVKPAKVIHPEITNTIAPVIVDTKPAKKATIKKTKETPADINTFFEV
jgi:hypothetical protein